MNIEAITNRLQVNTNTNISIEYEKKYLFGLIRKKKVLYRGWVEYTDDGSEKCIMWTNLPDSHQRHTPLQGCPREAIIIYIHGNNYRVWVGASARSMRRANQQESLDAVNWLTGAVVNWNKTL